MIQAGILPCAFLAAPFRDISVRDSSVPKRNRACHQNVRIVDCRGFSWYKSVHSFVRGAWNPLLTLEENLREMELAADAYWKSYPGTTPTKLRWRALTVRHCFHVLPGESILVLGAGSGLWTQHLNEVLQSENPITAVV